MGDTAYLIVLPGCADSDAPPDDVELSVLESPQSVWLSPSMAIAVTGLSRSMVYHRVKRQLPDDAPLLVAPLADAPKFKGLAEGTTKWVRQNL
jgi:predicted DNA-binding transcriptional regulator AlpA